MEHSWVKHQNNSDLLMLIKLEKPFLRHHSRGCGHRANTFFEGCLLSSICFPCPGWFRGVCSLRVRPMFVNVYIVHIYPHTHLLVKCSAVTDPCSCSGIRCNLKPTLGHSRHCYAGEWHWDKENKLSQTDTFIFCCKPQLNWFGFGVSIAWEQECYRSVPLTQKQFPSIPRNAPQFIWKMHPPRPRNANTPCRFDYSKGKGTCTIKCWKCNFSC